MSYTAKDIRNICLLGHGGDGKTILAEDMLFLTNGSDRLGSIADGNTVSDFDPEEIKRKYSISTSIIPVNFEGCKINLLDNPGFFDFAGEIVQSLRVADAGLIVPLGQGRHRRGYREGLEVPQERQHAHHVLHLQDGRGSRQLL